MRIYTKKGDQGNTSLFRGGRVSKDDIRVCAYGDVDELSTVIGVAASAEPQTFRIALLQDIQRDLLTMGAILATAADSRPSKSASKMALATDRITALEDAIDEASDLMLPLKAFVLPGGSQKAAAFHHSRTVCRRAERSVVALCRNESVPETVLQYLNRLSDLLFVLARLANHESGISDIEW